MDDREKARLDRLNRPQAAKPQVSLTLIVMICAALVVAVGLIGVMYFNNYDGMHSVAQGRQ